jgi:hypothetical protein
MIRLRVVAALLLVAGLTGSASASVTVGSMDSGNCYPFNCNDSGTNVGPSIDYQQVYAASAFPGPISISSITFQSFPGVPFEVLSGDYNITFSTTSAPVNGLDNTLANNVGPDVATFFNGHITGGPIGSTYTITGTPFNYNPMNGNLLMEVSVSNQDLIPNFDNNGYFWADYTGVVTSRIYAFNGSPDGNGNVTGALVTTFNATTTPEPSSMLIAGVAGMAVLGFSRLRRKASA